MAKRAGFPKTQARVTPTSKGVGVSTQSKGRPPIPGFAVGRPKAVSSDDETGLYSRPEEVIGKSAGRRPESVAAAQRRMRGPDADVELDALGEFELPSNEPAAVEDEQTVPEFDRATDADAQSLLASMQREPELASSFKSLIDGEVERRVREIMEKQQAQAQSIGAGQPPVQVQMPQQPQAQQFIATRRVDDRAIDLLWDWIRQDPEASEAFFGYVPPTSKQLRGIIDALQQGEAHGVGFIRTLVAEHHYGDAIGVRDPFGFAMVAPMFSEERLAVLHVFLEPKMRGRLPQLMPSLIELARQELPGYKLAVLPSTDAQRRLYGSLLPGLGFQAFTLYVK